MTIKGIEITLYEKTQTGVDGFGRPVYEETPTTIENVVVGQPTSDDVATETNLSGKRISYMLALPANDTHTWENVIVEFYGEKWRTVGIPQQFMDGFMGANFPWNKKIAVTRYDEAEDE